MNTRRCLALLFLCIELLSTPLVAIQAIHSGFQDSDHRILFLTHSGHVAEALNLYREAVKARGRHHFELLHEIGICILEEGWRSHDPETQFLTLFGTGISLQEKCLHILTDALRSPQPLLQLVALNFLGKIQDEESAIALKRAIGSPFLLIRLEAAAVLAERGDPQAVGQIESLMYKLPKEAQAVFPALYARIGGCDSIRMLKKLLASQLEDVRVAAVLSAARAKRDDLLPQIRSLAIHNEPLQQEACAFALGALHDEQSIGQLQKMTHSQSPSVRLAALQSLYQLGRKEESRQAIEQSALQEDLLAIAILGNMPGAQPALQQLASSPKFPVRLNAAMALLQLRDPIALHYLDDLFFHDTRELAFTQGLSPGKALQFWKVVSNAYAKSGEDTALLEVSLSMREESLNLALNLPEEHFLALAEKIFEYRQNDLVPRTCELLEQLKTPKATALLEHYQQKVGSPLIRNYCSLALFKLREEGPYAEHLKEWIHCQEGEELIRLRPILPSEMRGSACAHSLTPAETSKLLISTLEIFAASQESLGIEVLLDAIQYGHPKNKYALAGLLIRVAH